MKRIKRVIAAVLVFGMLASGVGMGNETISQAKAVKKPSVVKKATVMEGQVKSLVIKASGFKIKSITVKSSDKSVLKVKAKKKTKSINLTGVKTGFAKVTTTVIVLKNKKTKKYKLTTAVTVKGVAMPGYENIDVDYDVNTGKVIMNASVKMGLAVMDMFLPGGKIISKGLDSLYSDLVKGSSKSGDSQEIKDQLESISKDIKSLRTEIDTQFSSLKGQIDKGFEELEREIVSQSIMSSDGALFDKINTAVEASINQINSIMNDETINDETKAVYIADLIGKNSQWVSDGNNLVFLFKHYMNSLSSATFMNQDANTDIYDIAFEQAMNKTKKEIMFSPEARKVSDKYIQKVLLLGLNAYSVISFCLKAHELVSTITEDQVAPIAREKFKSIQTLTGIVDSELVTMSKKMFDAEMKDSVAYHLNEYLNNSPIIFVNKGTISKPYKKKLKVVTVNKGGNMQFYYNTCVELMKISGFDYQEKQGNVGWTSIPEFSDLTDYVHIKGVSMRDYLSEMGFDTSEIDDNTMFITGFARYYNIYYFNDAMRQKILLSGNYCNKVYGTDHDHSYDNAHLWSGMDELKLCFFEQDK